MPSIILSDNGVSSGSAGIKTTGGNDGVLILQTTTSGGTATNAVYVDTLQNVGLGVTPSAWAGGQVGLQVKNASLSGYSNSAYVMANAYYDGTNEKYIASSYASKYEQSSGAHKWYYAASGTAGNAITFTQAMTLDASGNLGIGVTSPGGRLDVGSSGSTKLFVRDRSDSDRGIYLDSGTSATGLALVSTNTASRALGFATNDTERARIDSSGNFLVGTTSDLGGTLNALGKVGRGPATFQVYTNGDWVVFKNASGTVVGKIQIDSSSTSYVTSSDYRLKENIHPMQNALTTVAQLNPVTYNWKVDGSNGQGFIAHELQALVPDCVVGEKDAVDEEGNPIYQGIDTSFLVATLTAAIQEQQAIITQLQADVAALKGAQA